MAEAEQKGPIPNSLVNRFGSVLSSPISPFSLWKLRTKVIIRKEPEAEGGKNYRALDIINLRHSLEQMGETEANNIIA